MEGKWNVSLCGGMLKSVHHPHTLLYGGHDWQTVPVVPCNDAAIERAARAIGKALPLSQREGLHRTLAETALRAAGETP